MPADRAGPPFGTSMFDPHRHALHHLHPVAGGVLRRQQRELLVGCRGDALHRAVEGAPGIGVHRHRRRIAGAGVGQRGLLRLRFDPYLVAADEAETGRAGGQIHAGLQFVPLGHHAGIGRPHHRVVQPPLRLIDLRLRLLVGGHPRHRLVRIAVEFGEDGPGLGLGCVQRFLVALQLVQRVVHLLLRRSRGLHQGGQPLIGDGVVLYLGALACRVGDGSLVVGLHRLQRETGLRQVGLGILQRDTGTSAGPAGTAPGPAAPSRPHAPECWRRCRIRRWRPSPRRPRHRHPRWKPSGRCRASRAVRRPERQRRRRPSTPSATGGRGCGCGLRGACRRPHDSGRWSATCRTCPGAKSV